MSATQYDKLKDVDERIFTAANSADAGSYTFSDLHSL